MGELDVLLHRVKMKEEALKTDWLLPTMRF